MLLLLRNDRTASRMRSDEMRRQIEEMKEWGVISEASGEWAAPVILITKSLQGIFSFIAFVRISEGFIKWPKYQSTQCRLSKRIWTD
jgi:hypothetical protein